MHFQFVASEIAIGLKRNLTMTIAVVITTAVSLALVASAMLMRSQVELMKGFWFDKIEVTIFLCDHVARSPNCGGKDVSNDQRDQIRSDLYANPQVEKVYFETKAQAYANFAQQFKDSPELVKGVEQDALPESYRVKLKDPEGFAVVASQFVDAPGVDSVTDIRKTLAPFFKFINGFRTVVFIVAGMSLLASALLIFNTIRVAAFSRRRETGIMRLVGASNLYIRLPFLLEGAIAGAVGGALACLSSALLKVFLIDRVLKPSLTFTPFISWHDVLGVFPVIMLTGVALATASSFFAIQRHLRV